MFIKSLTIKNFKCFGNSSDNVNFKIPDGKTPGSGLNILIGENNSGKSSLFEAVNFLRNGLPDKKSVDDLRNKFSKGDISVELNFCGKIGDVISNFAQENKKKLLLGYIYKNDTEFLTVRRSSKDDKQDKQKEQEQVEKDREEEKLRIIKNIYVLNKINGNFENKGGISAPIQKLFEISFIWSDTNPNDITKFGSTTICGKLLGEILSLFQGTKEYKDFSTAYDMAFNSPKSTLNKNLQGVKDRVNQILESQFSKADIIFHFNEIDPTLIFKNVAIKVNDGVETDLADKGSGMQRSVALSLLQVYAENLTKHPTNNKILKPFYLFIDEPEICLHPQAQRKLLEALKKITKTQQIFISTHSPYFVDLDLICNVFKFKNDSKNIKISCVMNDSDFDDINKSFFDAEIKEIFFAEKVICLEGNIDKKRIIKFCKENDIDTKNWTIITLKSKCELRKFWLILNSFCDNYKIITDLDLLCVQKFTDNGVSAFKCDCLKFVPKIEKEVVGLEKKNRDDLKKSQLTNEELIEKNQIIKELRSKNIFILKDGEIEDYLDGEGVSKSDERKDELLEVFNT